MPEVAKQWGCCSKAIRIPLWAFVCAVPAILFLQSSLSLSENKPYYFLRFQTKEVEFTVDEVESFCQLASVIVVM